MSDEKWLRDGLADAVPEPPTNPDRARAAERLARRRRRTTALAVLGSAGAVAAAAVLTVTLTSGGDDPDDAVDTASDGPAFVVDCPPIKLEKGGTAEGSEIDAPDPAAPSAVPEGATSARLCQGPGTTFDVPADALVTGVDDLVAAVNDLDVAGEPEVCTMDLGPGYRIAFGYDDGSTFVDQRPALRLPAPWSSAAATGPTRRPRRQRSSGCWTNSSERPTGRRPTTSTRQN